MRTSLFLAAAFATALVGGSAMAEKPDARPQREPRALDRVRAHGDVFDKSYRNDAKPGASQSQAGSAATSSAKGAPDHGASRVNCSADGSADCSASHGARAATRSIATSQATLKPDTKGTVNQFDQRADARYECNEGDQCSVSSKAAQRVWTQHGAGGAEQAQQHLGASTLPGAVSRLQEQRQSVGSFSEEGGIPATKASKGLWATEAVKAGTFKGPTDLDVSASTNKAVAEAMKKTQAQKAQKASSHQGN